MFILIILLLIVFCSLIGIICNLLKKAKSRPNQLPNIDELKVTSYISY